MRRMYSQAELSAIIKEVFLSDVASGQIDLPALIEQALPEVDFSTANFSDIDFKAKTLEQSEPNWHYDLSISSVTWPTGLEAELVYGRLEIINGVLFFVSSLKVINTTESAISISDVTINVNVPEEIGSKIYDINGGKVSESIPTGALITELELYKSGIGGTATSVVREGHSF